MDPHTVGPEGPIEGSSEPPVTIALPPHYTHHLGPGITLNIAPNYQTVWENFRIASPPFAIAVDGYVYGPPRFTHCGPRASMNHHEGVDRLFTRSSQEQIYVALKMGLVFTFSQDSQPRFEIFANDCDHDVCKCCWLLKNTPQIVGLNGNYRISRLVRVQDLMDTTAGAFPFDTNLPIMRELAWVFQPYDQARLNGLIRGMAGEEMCRIILEVGERIDHHVSEKINDQDRQAIDLDLRYETVFRSGSWAAIREIGAQARIGAFRDGITAIVSFSLDAQGRRRCAISKVSPFIPFPLLSMYDALNRAEGIPHDSLERWGGSNLQGGSPLAMGTDLEQSDILRVIQETVASGQMH